MSRLKIVLLTMLAALVGCHPYFIHTERQLKGYCAIQTMRLQGLDLITRYDSFVVFRAQAKAAGVTLRLRNDSLLCSGIVYR